MGESINKVRVKGITYDVEDSVARAGLAKVLLFESITWAELKSLKDSGNLAPGTKYRITDYITTTAKSNTISAGNQFDIIVEALTENTLNELASACLHEGDTYFSSNGCVLEAWQLWYDIENDTEKYDWADTENGKGVIYRMIDERENDCPYDFKNICFRNDSVGDYVYTFSYRIDGSNYDGTVDSRTRRVCHSNIIRRYSLTSGDLHLQYFNNIVFLNSTFYDNCYSNTFGNNCYSNTFGNNCYSNTFVGVELRRRISSNDSGNSITLNEEFYDDGSGNLVPIKHPDLSTQPSILSYKFMGQYVYEQLISAFDDNGEFTYTIPTSRLTVDNPIILECFVVGIGHTAPCEVRTNQVDGENYIEINVQSDNASDGKELYYKIVYTSMPEDSSYYY